jgi:hypothetical protein
VKWNPVASILRCNLRDYLRAASNEWLAWSSATYNCRVRNPRERKGKYFFHYRITSNPGFFPPLITGWVPWGCLVNHSLHRDAHDRAQARPVCVKVDKCIPHFADERWRQLKPWNTTCSGWSSSKQTAGVGFEHCVPVPVGSFGTSPGFARRKCE